jgi:hypothetical protein
VATGGINIDPFEFKSSQKTPVIPETKKSRRVKKGRKDRLKGKLDVRCSFVLFSLGETFLITKTPFFWQTDVVCTVDLLLNILFFCETIGFSSPTVILDENEVVNIEQDVTIETDINKQKNIPDTIENMKGMENHASIIQTETTNKFDKSRGRTVSSAECKSAVSGISSSDAALFKLSLVFIFSTVSGIISSNAVLLELSLLFISSITSCVGRMLPKETRQGCKKEIKSDQNKSAANMMQTSTAKNKKGVTCSKTFVWEEDEGNLCD